MKKRKVSFRQYRYEDCDDFALYLQEMSASGWHFQKWGMGLEFEKGEPGHERYDVQVFPGGSINDLSPSEDAKDFAAEAAGWEMVDARRRFCVFRQVRPDAPPIVTDMERYENIRKSAVKEDLYMMLSNLFVLGLFLFHMLYLNFEAWAFNNVLLFILVIGVSGDLQNLYYFSRMLRKIKGYGKVLDRGEVPWYGDRAGKHTQGPARWCIGQDLHSKLRI